MLRNPDLRRSLPDIEADDVDRRLADGWTLPASLYTSPAVAEAEDELVFRPGWHLVGTLADFREAGDYLTTFLGGKYPIIVARDFEGALRGFHNVCRHRGCLVAGGETGDVTCGQGQTQRFRCIYHGWTYGLDGRLIGVPDFRGARLPPFEELGLVPISIDTWAGLVFASIEPDSPLSTVVSGLAREADAAGYTMPFLNPEMRFVSDWEFVLRANWKVSLENNLECYHCAVTHSKTLGGACDVGAASMGSTDFENGNRIYTQLSADVESYFPADVITLLRAGTSASSEEPMQQYWLWPTNLFTTSVLFGDAIFRIDPIDVGSCRFIGRAYSRPGEEESTRAKLNDWIGEFVSEDIGVASGVQIGLQSGARETGPLLYKREGSISWCSELIWRHLGPAFR